MTDLEIMQKSLYYMDDKCGAYTDDYRKLIEVLRARLSQCERCGEVNPAEIHTCTPKPEPVAWGLQQQFEGRIGTTPVAFKRHDEFGFVVPLYTAGPQREWQGLTDEEIENCFEMSMFGTCRAIEAKLKEKNT